MSTTYLDLIHRGAGYNPERTAIVFGDESLTFGETQTLSNQLAHALIERGVRRGDRVALLLNNSLYSVPVDFACVKAGINRVPLNARLSLEEHARMLEETGVGMLLYGADLAERAAALGDARPGLVCHGIGADAVGDDLLAAAAGCSAAAPDVAVAPDDVILTLFTSGTTGTLKAAQHTQASYAGVCRNVLLNLLDVQRDDAMLHAASLIHASGVFVLPFWLRGARTVIMPGFDPGAFLDLIEQQGITAVNMVPTMLQMLLGHPRFESTDVSLLRQVIYGASPMPRPVIEQAMQLWGREKFWQYYGQTECPLAIAVLRPEDHRGDLLGACGRPSLDVEIRLVDEAGQDVPTGEPGEIAVRAPSMMAGYHNAPALNREMFMEGGWLRTRDVGEFDQRGYLHLKDRTSDMIITGGYNVYPREVEDVLIAHPAVAECAVIGVQDDKWVEAVTAVVALKPGQNVDQDSLIAFVAGKVASYKKPQRVIFTDAIPKTAVGKLNRKALRDQYGGN
ncbi:AMP-binding protein [Alloalcanivorax gelatiniphagus]|uniref:Long-chain fatty acid--CoA ligase n=1 Tax=Alloalcanivorax gelatiniphagus TaxID=1194167 RepID=A0ABY2XPV8_9GAMM|nr:AMP-binding protein [Alloalcanivorax gelatiniphagus]TMW14685.1 long-chain fatty acid--CoA ligase [Alloalcanivorax gelatiniphagus]